MLLITKKIIKDIFIESIEKKDISKIDEFIDIIYNGIIEKNDILKKIDNKFENLVTKQDLKLVIDMFNKRFETIDKRFETMDKRFETIDKRFEMIDKRFEELREDMNKRFTIMFTFITIGFSLITLLIVVFKFLI